MFKIVLVKGHSMAPTLDAGDRVLAWTPFSKRLFRRGNIVTLCPFHIRLTDKNRPQAEFQSTIAFLEYELPELFIKRIVGLPGDTIRISATQLPQHTMSAIDPRAIRHGDELLWHIPEDHIFVRGDGVQSGDSITWGPIPLIRLRQIVLCRFPSLQRIQ